MTDASIFAALVCAAGVLLIVSTLLMIVIEVDAHRRAERRRKIALEQEQRIHIAKLYGRRIG